MSKPSVIYAAERSAYSYLSSKEQNGQPNPFYCNPQFITMPSVLIQEKPLDGSTNSIEFVFSSKTDKPSDTLNNVNIGENDVATIYGVQLLLGYGATVTRRQYYSYGLTIDDDVVYKSKLNFQFETNVSIKEIETNIYRREDGLDKDQYDGLALMNPQRTFTGQVSEVKATLKLGTITGFAFSANTFVSLRLWTARGLGNTGKS